MSVRIEPVNIRGCEMTKYLPFILFTVLTNAAAQIMLKQGMMSLGPLTFSADTIISRIFQIIFNPWVFFGLATFVISMASHLFVLSKVDLSFAYPFLSLAYVVVAVIAWLVFKEELGIYKIAGIALICAGTILIAQSGGHSAAEANNISNSSSEAAS
jgi:drug/metabolite transporter (DMT)-like permease